MSSNADSSFREVTRAARKIMVLDLGFIGDTVHLMPALWVIRQAYPQAQLHVTVAEHVTSLLECLPWVDRAWGYPRFPRHATLRQNLGAVARMRRERFDALINLNGSDRSSWLSFFSGARYRLGRMPGNGGPPFWRWMFTHHARYRSLEEPVYVQKCRCLEQAGFARTVPEFRVEISPARLRAAQISEADKSTYFHLSPFTTTEQKELPPEQLAQLIGQLSKRFPAMRWVLTSGPSERERGKMDSLLAYLEPKPWKAFSGQLNLIELAAVIRNSALHLSGDSGPLHLALMTGTPAVSWFRPNPGMFAWAPSGDKYRSFAGVTEAGATYLGGIDAGQLVEAASALLRHYS